MKKSLALLIAVILTFTSCLGMSIDIQMNRDGSGKITMEYRVSRILDTLGAFDGSNETLSVPISRLDWERSIERVNGLKIDSFSVSQKGQDTISTVVLEFDNFEALLAVLDPESKISSITQKNNQNRLDFILNGNASSIDFSKYDDALMEYARTLFSDYNFSMSFSAPGNSSLSFTDGSGKEIPRPSTAETVLSGRRVSMSIGIMDLLELTDGLGVRFNW